MPNEEIGGFLQFFWTSLKGLSIVETLNLLFPGLRILDLSLGPISFMGVRTPLRTEWVNSAQAKIVSNPTEDYVLIRQF